MKGVNRMPSKQTFPFVFHDGVYAKFSKKKNAGMIKNIRVMFEKQFLDVVDTDIMLHLQKYIYLNSFLIRTLLKRKLGECTTDFCNEHLKKLEKLGFVVRFQFVYKGDDGKEHATPFVYALSVSAKKLFSVKGDKSYVDSYMDVDCVLRRLAYNQFHIIFEGQYEGALSYSSYVFDAEYDGLYKLKSKDLPIIFYAISIRNSIDWEKRYLDRLRTLREHIKAAGLSYSGIIVICESEYQSLRAERCRSGDKELSSMDVYYLCDYAAVIEGVVLDHVICVKPEDNYSTYDIISINVDGAVKQNVELKI